MIISQWPIVSVKSFIKWPFFVILLDKKRGRDRHLIGGSKGIKVGAALSKDAFSIIWFHWSSLYLPGIGISIYKDNHVGKGRDNLGIGTINRNGDGKVDNPDTGNINIEGDGRTDKLGIDLIDVDGDGRMDKVSIGITDGRVDNPSTNTIDRGVDNPGTIDANGIDNPGIGIKNDNLYTSW